MFFKRTISILHENLVMYQSTELVVLVF